MTEITHKALIELGLQHDSETNIYSKEGSSITLRPKDGHYFIYQGIHPLLPDYIAKSMEHVNDLYK